MPKQDLLRFKNNIQFEVERIDEMINRLLALATLESWESLQNVEAVELATIIKKVIESKQPLLDEKNLEFEMLTSPELVVSGDSFLLTQLFDNLIQNAIEFSINSGKITIEAKADKCLELSIKDDGTGIPDYAMDKIFERFYSLARPASNKKSSGLGLSFVKQIVELHNGRVEIKNQTTAGVRVDIWLPL